eukprot:3795451-Rhodomonas_salina.2
MLSVFATSPGLKVWSFSARMKSPGSTIRTVSTGIRPGTVAPYGVLVLWNGSLGVVAPYPVLVLGNVTILRQDASPLQHHTPRQYRNSSTSCSAIQQASELRCLSEPESSRPGR